MVGLEAFLRGCHGDLLSAFNNMPHKQHTNTDAWFALNVVTLRPDDSTDAASSMETQRTASPV